MILLCISDNSGVSTKSSKLFNNSRNKNSSSEKRSSLFKTGRCLVNLVGTGTFSKFITLYQANTFDDIRKKQIFTEIANDKFILNNAIFSYNYESVQIVKFNKIPFDLENVYEVKIYTIDSIDKTLTLPEDTFCDILLVGGGGGGGKNAGCEGGGGGGGGTVIHLTNCRL